MVGVWGMYVIKTNGDYIEIGGDGYNVAPHIKHFLEKNNSGRVIRKTRDNLEIECKLCDLISTIKRLAHRYIDWNLYNNVTEIMHFLDEVHTYISAGDLSPDDLVRFNVFYYEY